MLRKIMSGTIATVLRRLARDAVVVASLALAAEASLRQLDPRYGRHVFTQELTGGYPIAINSLGFRGPEPKAKGDEERRILAVGDSVTFGTGVAWDAAWPEQVAAALRARGLESTAVNGAMPGADLRQIAFALGEAWGSLEPDVVVACVSGNMVSLAWIRRDEAPRVPENGFTRPTENSPRGGLRGALRSLRLEVKGLCLPAFLTRNGERGLYQVGLLSHTIDPRAPYGAMLAYGWRQLTVPADLPEEAWMCFESDLLAFRAAVERTGARAVVTFCPARFVLSDALIDNEKAVPKKRLTIDPVERVRAICARHGIEYVDARAALRAGREAIRAGADRFAPLYFQSDYTHLDEEGHRVLAEAIAASPGVAGPGPGPGEAAP